MSIVIPPHILAQCESEKRGEKYRELEAVIHNAHLDALQGAPPVVTRAELIRLCSLKEELEIVLATVTELVDDWNPPVEDEE